MTDPCTADSRHQVSAEETEIRFCVNFFQRPHQMGCVKVA
jgi:hypothetical protein